MKHKLKNYFLSPRQPFPPKENSVPSDEAAYLKKNNHLDLIDNDQISAGNPAGYQYLIRGEVLKFKLKYFNSEAWACVTAPVLIKDILFILTVSSNTISTFFLSLILSPKRWNKQH